MPSLIPGRIVFPTVAIPDPQGNNPKEHRPFVVVSSQEEIAGASSVLAVGITSAYYSSDQDHYIRLPGGPKSWHRCKEGSMALCTWLIDVPISLLTFEARMVAPKTLREILERVKALAPTPRVIPAPPPTPKSE